ncbi:Asp23/Gls24 family envelope stress response protein [Sporohalobacter salinus]|uniref:Asp23/Gls24 family envelope stress response protein n=1 Tax=Sporohalobacter salinus TaxID=1494606 RepID=UPI00196103E3|nr:Asp23/Gls24 family envelope stress response protein [Sporohalobacter salinus]MBM7623324.1 putative alkaline shock family protein YloU [Sporohalobacter salinus]
MQKELENELGKITISKDVISIIAGMAAVECYGLVGMATQRVKDGINELLGRDNLRKGVEVIIEEGAVRINLYIIVEYGINISEVANNVIDKVKYTLEDTAGVEVSEININVQGVRVGEVQE